MSDGPWSPRQKKMKFTGLHQGPGSDPLIFAKFATDRHKVCISFCLALNCTSKNRTNAKELAFIRWSQVAVVFYVFSELNLS